MEISPYASEIKTILSKVSGINKVELVKFEETEEYYVIHLSINTYPIKLITNFDNYCYFESEIIPTEELNNYFFENKTNKPEYIVSKLNDYKINVQTKDKVDVVDRYHIYQKIEEISKVLINYELVEKESKLLRDSKSSIDISKFPKELLFNPNQIYQIIVNEMKSFNQNLSFKHFIEPINNNPYNLKLVSYLTNAKVKDFVIEMKISVEPKLYPFYPPRIEFIRPSIKLPLVYSLMNMKLLKMENWNPTISLQWLIEKLVEQLQPIIHDYVKEGTVKYPEMDALLVKLASLTKEYSAELDLLNITAPKVTMDSGNDGTNANKYWKSGVGYGHDQRAAWDISAYIKEQEVQNNELANLVKQISEYIVEESMDELFSSTFVTFVVNRIKGLTLLELEKNQGLYREILLSLNKLIKYDSFKSRVTFINNLGEAFSVVADEIQSLFQSRPETQDNELYLQIHCMADWFKSNTKVESTVVTVEETNKDIKAEYEAVMKKLQFGPYEIPSSHRFKEYLTQKPESKAVMRMISEISTFKTGLPLNWESTVWVRVSKQNMNVFSFFISGPKDTPYENGIFEFHAAFPTNYPNSEPKVLLDTTGGGKVRFNPNLYHCGKVCLSLLGTWSGQEGEKWNPKTSTFLQVLVSIQSLIFVENPYFNEPGWEREMHTPAGQKKSKDYNEPLQIGTIEWAINGMLRNPPNGMEEVVKTHFRMKREEITKTTLKWLNEMSPGSKPRFEKVRSEMLELFEVL